MGLIPLNKSEKKEIIKSIDNLINGLKTQKQSIIGKDNIALLQPVISITDLKVTIVQIFGLLVRLNKKSVKIKRQKFKLVTNSIHQKY